MLANFIGLYSTISCRSLRRNGRAGEDPGARALLGTDYDWRKAEARLNALLAEEIPAAFRSLR